MQAVDATKRTDRVTVLDEVVLYAAAGTALGMAPFTAGAGGGSVQIAVVGFALVIAGALVSWRIRERGWGAILIGAPLGLAAAAAFNLLVERELSMDESGLMTAQGELGLMLALRMAILPIILSFVLVKHDIIAFALVPALATFGLVGGQGDTLTVALCFAVFLPMALIALGNGVLLAGLIRAGGREESHSSGPQGAYWRLGNWRRRHWAALMAMIGLVVVIAYALFFPIAYYVNKYRWQVLTRMAVGSIGQRPMGPMMGARERIGSVLPVGRGPISPSRTPMLTVWGQPEPLWRGQVFDYFTGQTWMRSESAPEGEQSTPAEAAALPPPIARGADRGTLDISAEFPPQPATRPESHLVRVESGLAAVFFSPGQIERLTGRDVQDRSPLRIDAYGCVEAPEQQWRNGSYYEVVSTPLEIRGSPSQTERAMPVTELPRSYLTLPSRSARLADLAREVAGNEPSPERKLMALIGYLQRNYFYTLDPPPTPPGRDAADYFLFESRRGYCDLFATALALMGRAVGIPTRVADGFAYGSDEPEGQVLHPRPDNPTGAPEPNYQMTEADGHVWVEAYVEPWGWVSVDATPASGKSPISPLRSAALQTQILFHEHPSVPFAGAALLIALGIWFWLQIRAMQVEIPRFAEGGIQPSEARYGVIRAYGQLLLALRRLGQARRPSQTPLEYLDQLRALAGQRPVAPASDVILPKPKRRRGRRGAGTPRLLPLQSALPAIAAVTDLFLLARYSPAAVTEETAASAAQQAQAARRALR
jgi:transglutaminase-like putative cysteine protease